MKPHDFQFGWFTVIAERHGRASQECQQAKSIVVIAGQFYFPEIESGISKAGVLNKTAGRLRNLELTK